MIDVAALAHECGFGRIADELAALARPSLRLRLEGEGRSRLARLEGEPPGTRVFAELDMAELDPSVWPGPRSGVLRLSAYQDPDHWGIEGGGEATVVDAVTIDGVPVTAIPEVTIPHIGVDTALALIPFDLDWKRDWEAYSELEMRLAEAQGFPRREPNGRWATQHRVLGWPQHVQGDVIEELELDSEAPLTLLVQIEGGGPLGDGFEDSLFFGIPPEDLERGRFDRVRAISQGG